MASCSAFLFEASSCSNCSSDGRAKLCERLSCTLGLAYRGWRGMQQDCNCCKYLGFVSRQGTYGFVRSRRQYGFGWCKVDAKNRWLAVRNVSSIVLKFLFCRDWIRLICTSDTKAPHIGP
ncbi:uncharacterized protein LOC127565605 [Drosophila albomicans]|uniref:Uncharacterized protein LOC127565605 n=1 Tax=Drosophila albomicans TaxID=7291 RepID=A0A9C6WFF1_DROAB|nr:uncharacterized protein LOC127565605 [Drosophila albomicans]